MSLSWNTNILFLELFSNIIDGASRDFNPGLREKTAGSDNKDHIEDSVDRVSDDLKSGSRGADVVDESTYWNRVGSSQLNVLPRSEEIYQEVSTEVSVENLRDEEQVGDEGSLENDGDVGSVEQLDWVWLSLALNSVALDSKINSESLEEDDDEEYEDSGEKIDKVWQLRSVEWVLDSLEFVRSKEDGVQESNDRSLVLLSVRGGLGDGGEWLPDNGLTDVDGNEEGDTRVSDTVSLLEEFVQEDDDDSGKGQLDDNQEGVSGSELVEISVDSTPDIGKGLEKSNNQSQQLLSSIEEGRLFFVVLVELNQLSSSQ